MGIEKYMYGQVSPDEDEKVAEGRGIDRGEAKNATKEIQQANVVREEKLFQAELSAEKKSYLIEEKQKKIAEFQNNLKILEASGNETKKILQEKLVEELQFDLEEVQGIKDEEVVRIKNKLQSILEYVQSL